MISHSGVSVHGVPIPWLDVRVRRFRGVLLLQRGDNALQLSESAEAMWRAIDGARTIRHIAELVAGQYEMALDKVEADVIDTVQAFSEAGLLKAVRVVGPADAV